MRTRSSAFSPLELLTTATIGILLLSLALPAGARVRELSKRSTCAINLAGIGASAKIYANDNAEQWMMPPFSGKAYEPGRSGIDYLNDDGTIGQGQANTDPGEIGYQRDMETTSDVPGGSDGSTAVSVTRAFWMLVRSRDVSVKQFVCPSSGDVADSTENIDRYYDFTGFANISYGYRVPYGPRDTQPREGADNGLIFAADKSPYYLPGSDPTDRFYTAGKYNRPITLDDPPLNWQPFNSPNHGGRKYGEGQNVLFANGGVSFVRIPVIGIDDDNIYTVMYDRWDETGFNRIHGDSVHISAVQNPYPGVEALGAGDSSAYASTDSLIYP